MCGIAALVRRDRPIDGADQLRMARLLEVIDYRGPDAAAHWTCGGVLLGHRRLSIIDLSDAGNQPFHAEEAGLHVVFNGEIYNYRELRAELAGHWRFRSATDTEVLLAAYEHFGMSFVEKLRGMFAFALLDERRSKLVVARDRMGQKPVFYRLDGQRLAVASELKAFHAFPEMDLEVDPESIEAYFALQYVPGPYTIYKGVRKLLPGHVLCLDLAEWRAEEHEYWSLTRIRGAATGDPVDLVHESLRESIRYRLIADVEVGVLLSGGLDSTLVSCFANDQADRSLRAFTVGFGRGDLDESPVAREVAAAIGMPLVVEDGDLVDAALLERVTFHADEPLADPACLPTYLIAKELARHVKVVLSGEGADELFWGYPHYLRQALLGRLPTLFGQNGRASGPAWTTMFEDSPRAPSLVSRLQKVLSTAEVLGPARWTSVFGPSSLGQLMAPPAGARYVEQFESLGRALDRMSPSAERSGLVDMAFWLPDDLLVKVDRMTMAHSVEARAPFLDHHLVELTVRLPAHTKTDRRQTKKLLRALADKHLPSDVGRIVSSRKKHGFEVPLDEWLRGPLSEFAQATLDPVRVGATDVLNPVYVSELWRRFKESSRASSGFARKIWSLVCFMSWFQHHLHGFGMRTDLARRGPTASSWP